MVKGLISTSFRITEKFENDDIPFTLHSTKTPFQSKSVLAESNILPHSEKGGGGGRIFGFVHSAMGIPNGTGPRCVWEPHHTRAHLCPLQHWGITLCLWDSTYWGCATPVQW